MQLKLSKIAFISHLILVLHLISISAVANTNNVQVAPNFHFASSKTIGAIIPGAGYSHDSELVPPNICYNSKITTTTGQQGVIKLNTATSFSDLEKQLHISVSAKFGIGRFSIGGDSDYLRSIQDLDYSLSLNYYEYLFHDVMLQLEGVGQGILTQHGKDIYNNAKEYFGLLCGDDYISSYQQGAILLMGINIRFHNHIDKEQFNASMGGSFGNIINASTQIQNYAKQHNLIGSVVIQAYQKGGNPSELSKILAKDEKGVYYALSCDLQHMDNCVNAANGLLHYAAEYFPKQVSFKPGEEIGLTPLGMGFIRHDPIYEYGLTPPPSLVTNQVIEDRTTLVNLLDENQYYQQKFNDLLSGYPVTWDTNSDFYKTAIHLYKQANNNVDFILMPTNPDDGGLKCYTHPTLCHQTFKTIQQQIIPIIPSQLEFLNTISLKLNLVQLHKVWMYDWYPCNEKNTYLLFNSQSGSYATFQFTETGLSNVKVHASGIDFTGSLQKKNINYYSGELHSYLGPSPTNIEMATNPFYFAAYKPSR